MTTLANTLSGAMQRFDEEWKKTFARQAKPAEYVVTTLLRYLLGDPEVPRFAAVVDIRERAWMAVMTCAEQAVAAVNLDELDTGTLAKQRAERDATLDENHQFGLPCTDAAAREVWQAVRTGIQRGRENWSLRLQVARIFALYAGDQTASKDALSRYDFSDTVHPFVMALVIKCLPHKPGPEILRRLGPAPESDV